MKKKVYWSFNAVVYKEVEIDNSKLEGMSEDEIDELFVEKAYEEFGGIKSIVGNGGTDKLIGVHGRDEGIYKDCEIES
jgi:hypothetical protein